MAVMTSAQLCQKLLNIVNRPNGYKNWFPYNLGFYDGSRITFDCWNLVKALINEPNIDSNYTVGHHAPAVGNMPDIDGWNILMNCTNVSQNFSSLIAGEFLYMEGHAGVYIGNGRVVECTTDWSGGVQISSITSSGARHKGGIYGRSWTHHGRLTKWINYSAQPQPTPAGAIFTYQVWDDLGDRWLPNVRNDEDYAGEFGSDVCAIYLDCNLGDVRHAVHTWSGDHLEHYPDGVWLPEVTNRSDYAGLFDRPIDAWIVFSKVPAKYRVHMRKTKNWLDWVRTADANYQDDEYGFAGIIGEPIDAVEIMPL